MTNQPHSFSLFSVFAPAAPVRVGFLSLLMLGTVAQSADTDAKIKDVDGSAINTITSLVPVDETTLLIESEVEGKLTHFGKFTGTFSYTAILSPTSVELTGVATFTNHLGEKLFITAHIVEEGEGYPFVVDGLLTVTGGTGDYADAGGTFSVRGLDQESPVDMLELHGALTTLR